MTPLNDFAKLTAEEQAERLAALGETALAAWPLRFERLSLVKYRENAVFSTRCEAGHRYAVRVHRNDYHSDTALACELGWMAALRDHGLSIPRIVASSDGRFFTRHSHPDAPGERQIDVLEWLPGLPMGTSEDGLTAKGEQAVAQMHRLGELMAQMHKLTAQWIGLATASRHSWDAEGLTGEAPLWGRFWDFAPLAESERTLLIEARNAARLDLERLDTGPETYGLIHADLVPENVLIDGDTLSVIDFDDSGFGWHMFDLATALQFLVDQPDYCDLHRALLAGYRQHRGLSAHQEAQLPLFLFLRSSTYLGWMQTRPEMELPPEMVVMLQDRCLRLARTYLGGKAQAFQ